MIQLSLVRLKAYNPQLNHQPSTFASLCNPLHGYPLDIAELQSSLSSRNSTPGAQSLAARIQAQVDAIVRAP